MKAILVAGARPNFMKVAPLHRESTHRLGVQCDLVHTGQHYDYSLSETFFKDLELPSPVRSLGVGSGSHADQTAKTLMGFERVCIEEKPDIVIVVGDVNSTLACTLAAKKLCIRVAHVEAGLRSGDLSMPEEINRIMTDSVADDLFVTEPRGVENLLREGKNPSRVHFVGHVMIDNLFSQLEKLGNDGSDLFATAPIKARCPSYVFTTLHRPSNVDDPETLRGIIGALNAISEECPLFFPVHPRTRERLTSFHIELGPRIRDLPPLGFREALFLWKDAQAVLTDSGGLQEETTALGIPCITMRENTERPITVELGTNELAGTDPQAIFAAWRRLRERRGIPRRVPPLWDGKASIRIWDILCESTERVV